MDLSEHMFSVDLDLWNLNEISYSTIEFWKDVQHFKLSLEIKEFIKNEVDCSIKMNETPCHHFLRIHPFLAFPFFGLSRKVHKSWLAVCNNHGNPPEIAAILPFTSMTFMFTFPPFSTGKGRKMFRLTTFSRTFRKQVGRKGKILHLVMQIDLFPSTFWPQNHQKLN